MSFLEEFDRRAERKPGDAPPEGESPENRELLDFADLVRARRAAPTEEERERVLERVRQAQTPSPLGGEGWGEGASRFRPWLVAAAALLVLAVLVGLLSRSGPPSAPTVAVSDGVKLVADAGASLRGSRTSEEFGELDFPKPQLQEGNGAAAVEARTDAQTARLTRVHGLVLMQAKGETRWRVCQRGQALAFGDTIRTSKRLDSSVRILAPDGSAVSLAAGSTIVYGVSPAMSRITPPTRDVGMPPRPRAWRLAEGTAQCEVAANPEPFLVETPHAVAQARGTRFQLVVSAKSTLCSLDDGSVALRTDHATSSDVAVGQSVLADGKTTVASNEKGSAAWLKILEAEAASDYGIGQLVAKAEKANEHLPLEIKSHAVTVTVVDQVARTFVDEVFINNTDRRLEGVFYYPLPADASISEFAMYVNDQRIVGEVLEQQRARQIFEYIVRQQRDPALLEYAGGNLFKMRVFPIEPHSEKRIQLGYTQILPRSSGRVTYTYPLYSEKLIKNPLHDLTIQFRVVSSPGLSNIVSPTHDAPSAISADGKRGALAFRAKNYSPTRDFTVTYSVPDGAECVAFANLRPDDPLGYFMLQLCPKVELPRRDPPHRLLVVVDGSASAGPQEYAVATEFAASAADVCGNWQFGLLRGGQKPQAFGEMAHGDSETSTKVRDFLQKNQPLGATDLLETFRQIARMAKADEGIQVVYVGDGIDTVSELAGPALVKEIVALFKGKNVKVSTVAVGSSYDRPVLQGIAAKLGGTFTRVEGAADVHEGVGQVFESFYRPLLQDVMVSFEGVETSAVYPEFIGTLAAGDTAVVLGRYRAPSPPTPLPAGERGVKGRVKILADQAGRLVERGYDIDLSADEQSNRFLPRLWAKAHIDGLLAQMGLGSPADDARTKQEVIRTSIDYQIMSPFTAFLVLESEEDYARFGIKRTLKKWDWTGDVAGFPASGDRRDLSKGLGLKAATQIDAPAEWGAQQKAGYVWDSSDLLAMPGSSPEPMMDWKGKTAGLDEDDKFLASINGDLSERLEERAKEQRWAEGADIEVPADVLAQAELGDHFETLSFFDASERGSFRQEFALRETAKSGELSDLIGVGGYASPGWGGGWGGRARYGRRGYYYPQYSSLVFHGGKVPLPQIPRPRVEIRELEVDQPLRPLVYYQRFAASGKGTLSTQLNLSLALEQAGRFDEAMKALAPVFREFPTSADLWLQYGCLRYRSGDPGGCMDAFEKALPHTQEDGWPAKNERVASLLGSLGQYAAAAERYAMLARAMQQAEQAQRLAVQAASHYQSGGHAEKGWALWEELLKRWPNDAKLMAAAGQFAAQNGQLERGVELVRAARKLDPKIAVNLVCQYAQRGLRAEAVEEYRAAVETAADANQVYGVLQGINSLGAGVAAQEALKLLGEGRTAAQVGGAVQFLQSYGALRDKAGVEALFGAAQRKDFPAQARLNAFYALANARNYLRSVKLDPAAVLGPLCEDPQKEEEWNLATQALSAMAGHGFHKEALELAQKLQQRADAAEAARASLAQTGFTALNALGRQKEIEERFPKVLAAAKDEHSAYQPTWQVFWARLNRSEVEGAAQVVEAFAQRFPDSQYLPRFYSQLLQRLRQGEKKDEAAALIEKLVKAHPENALYQEMRARTRAAQGKFGEAAESVRAGIKALEKDAETRRRGDAERRGEGETGKRGTEETKDEEARKQAEKEYLAKAREEQRRAQRHALISLLAQLSAQDAELRAAFLKEAPEKAKDEDPALREWTEAALTCLNAAGDVAGHLKRLTALAQSEPNDPLWTRRLGYALLSARKHDEARKTLAKLSDSEPDDVELALSLRGLCEQLKDAPAAEKYFTRAFEALAKQPQRLQQYAQQWQSRKPQWALKAWTRLLEKHAAQAGGQGHAAYQAAQVCQQMGREKETGEFLFRALLSGDSGYAQPALNSLVSLAQKEEHLRTVLPLARQALEEKPDARKAVFLQVLVYHLEKLKSPNAASDAARAALDAAAAAELPENDSSAGMCVLAALVKEGQKDRAEKYALEGGGKLNADARRNLIRHAVNSELGHDKPRGRAIRLARALLAMPDYNRDDDHRRLVELLVEDGQLAEAEAEARKMQATPQSWAIYNSWSRLVQAYQNKGDRNRALALALDAWQALKDDPSYADSAFNQLTSQLHEALSHDEKISDAVRTVVTAKIGEWARACFGGEGRWLSWVHSVGNVMDKLGLRDEIAALARDAGASDDVQRVAVAAAYYRYPAQQYDEARRLYRRALTLPGADERNIYSQLYSLLIERHDKHQPEWGDALEILEKLKELKVYDENHYLAERGRCLYGLKRTDEAREVYRKLLARPSYWRQGYWTMQSLAYQFQESKDWAMAAEAWEMAIKLLRRQSRGQVDAGHAAQFYRACAEAYVQLGEKDKALDCFLRGMSVIPRHDSHYQQVLDAALKQVLQGQALDKTVEEYEKGVAASGGAERPHLRLAFADGYRKANETRKMLCHLSIASNLLPKDTRLRQQVIDGYRGLGDHEAALAAYRDWAKLDSQNIEIYRGMGDLFQSLGRKDEALLAWATMAEVRPREAEGYRAYAQKLVSVQNCEAAAAALRHALRYRSTEFDISKELAEVYKTLKQEDRIPALWTAGETACRKAMEDFADDPLPWLNLGRFLGTQGRAKEEASLYREILARQWPRFQRETYDDARKRLQAMK